jgi:hypothetical protein
MSMRRFTRPTNGLSKKVEKHTYAIALHSAPHHQARSIEDLIALITDVGAEAA